MSKGKKLRTNDGITCSKVRLVDENATQHGIVSIEEALKVAKDAGLDLVEVSPNANPPVCRVMDYGKLVYHKKKQVSNNKTKVSLKEIKFRPNTDVGDFNIKLKKILSFINVGHRVKVTVIFRGREMMHRDLGAVILDRVEQALHEIADVEQTPSQEGKQLYMIVSPRKS